MVGRGLYTRPVVELGGEGLGFRVGGLEGLESGEEGEKEGRERGGRERRRVCAAFGVLGSEGPCTGVVKA